MSDTATAPVDAPATTTNSGTGFLSGEGTPSPPPPKTNEGDVNFFSDAFQKGGKYVEGFSEHFGKMGLTRVENFFKTKPDEKTAWQSLEHHLQFIGKKAGHLPPIDQATPEEIAAYREQIGAPKESKDYGFKPEGLPEGMPWDEAKAGEFEALMHKHHVPAGFAKEASKFYADVLNGTAAAAKENWNQRLSEGQAKCEAHFKKEWGPEYDTRLQANADWIKAKGWDMSNPQMQMATSMPEFVELIDRDRRESRGLLPGAGNETVNAMSAKQQLNDFLSENPDWERVPEKHRKATELARLAQVQESRK